MNRIKNHPYIACGVAAFLLLLVGFSLGASGEAPAAPSPQAETVTVTETEQVEVTPKVCKQSLRGFLRVINLQNEASLLILNGTTNLDVIKIQKGTAKIHHATDVLETMTDPASECIHS